MTEVNERLTPEAGALELSIMNAETESRSFQDILVELLNKSVPAEIVTRLEELWDVTKRVAGEVMRVGRIIVLKIVDFVRANPNLAAGMAIGAAVGALVGLVPWIGPLLQPIAMAIGAVTGAALGNRMDNNLSVGPLSKAQWCWQGSSLNCWLASSMR